MTTKLAEINLPETDDVFMYMPYEEDEEFIEPIKNPFSCEGAYLLACKDVANQLAAHKEVGNDVSVYIQMQNWLDKLAYEYI